MKKHIRNLLAKHMPDTYDKLASVYGYWRAFGRFPNFIRPRRFTEKLVRKRLLYRDNPTMTVTADKWAVREYVEKRVGKEILSDVYAVTGDLNQLDLEKLPLPVVLKSTHGSGHVHILSDKSFDRTQIKAELARWLSQSFPLWYRKIPPQIIAEEFLGKPTGDDLSKNTPNDYKFFVFRGKVELVVVDVGRFSGHARALYLPSWELLDVGYLYPKAGPQPRPANLDKMLTIASKLGETFDFVRIDLYDLGDRIVFGEITHSPDQGKLHFSPADFDLWLGEKFA